MSMLSPKRSKFRKSHKGHLAGMAKGGNEVSFGVRQGAAERTFVGTAVQRLPS